MSSRAWIILLGLLFVAFCVNAVFERPTPKRQKITGANVHEVWVTAQEFVKDNLKSPSTASFGSAMKDYQDPNDTVMQVGDRQYIVKGWVDTQNGFGATVRVDFALEMQKTGNKYKLMGIDLKEF